MIATKSATISDLEGVPDDGYRYELLRGELTRMAPTGEEHGDIVREVIWLLEKHIRSHDVGKIVLPDTAFIISRGPDTTFVPDASFIRYDRLPQQRDRKKYIDSPPDLAVEVISPSDRPARVSRKVSVYLDAGVQMVLLVDPERRTIDVYRPGPSVVTLSGDDVFDGGDVLPGFEFRVGDVFPEERSGR